MSLSEACCAQHAPLFAPLLRAATGAAGGANAAGDLTQATAADRAALPQGAAVASEIAYVMNGFPRLSETFIANEIHLLETLGLKLRLYSVKQEHEPHRHPVVDRIAAPLTYLADATSLSGTSLAGWLRRNLPTFAGSNWQVFKRHPLRWLRTAAAAAAFAVRYRPGPWRLRKVFIKEFLQAGAIAADVLAQRGRVGHLHGHFCHGVATITWFVSKLTGIPFSFTAHAKDIYQAELNPGDLLERKLGAARFVATCTGANAEVLAARAPDANLVHTIYHGLDTEWFQPRPAPKTGAPLILAVGRFVEKKGFDHLVEACAKLKDAGVAFRLWIVGERGSAYDAINDLVAERGLQQHVELRGAVTQDALRDIYREASVFALPCQVMADGDRDGIPNVLAEAMASGVPVVSTRISGIPELIDDDVHGLLVPPRSVEALAGALRAVLTDAALHARLAAAGRDRICEVFDSRRTTIALRDLFAAQLRARAAAAA